MTILLASLAGAALMAADSRARHWREAASGVTIQVPEHEAAAASALLGPTAVRLTKSEVVTALQPWLGADASHLAVELPAVFVLPGPVPPGLSQALAHAAPRAMLSSQTPLQARAAVLATRLQTGARLAAATVALSVAGVIAAATAASLSAQQNTIEIVHHLGATDGLIAADLAGQAALASFAGAASGAGLAAIVLLGAAQFGPPVRVLLAALPLLAATLCWLTAQAAVRARLRRLP